MNIEDNNILVTYTYDDLDRLIYKNYYKTDVPYSISNGPRSGKSFVNEKKPKKLIYQDVYTYKGKRLLSPNIKRVHQPLIEASAIRVINQVTVSANIMCQSTVLASGFMWSTNNDTIFRAMLRPANFFKYGDDSGNINMLDAGVSLPFKSFKGPNAVGAKRHIITSSPTIYIKAFAQVETGTLFSKTIEI
jgi:hypothetical protein